MYIAESTTGDQGSGNDDITTFLGPLKCIDVGDSAGFM
jgi:hypothetical protein